MSQKIKVGDTVVVRGGFGQEAPQKVKVKGLGEKNGRPLFDYTDASGKSRWAYYDQIVGREV